MLFTIPKKLLMEFEKFTFKYSLKITFPINLLTCCSCIKQRSVIIEITAE